MKTIAIPFTVMQCTDNTCYKDRTLGCPFIVHAQSSVGCGAFGPRLDRNQEGNPLRCKECRAGERFTGNTAEEIKDAIDKYLLSEGWILT